MPVGCDACDILIGFGEMPEEVDVMLRASVVAYRSEQAHRSPRPWVKLSGATLTGRSAFP